MNKSTRKLALAFLALVNLNLTILLFFQKLVKQGSKYESDVTIFPSIIQNLDHDDVEVGFLTNSSAYPNPT